MMRLRGFILILSAMLMLTSCGGNIPILSPIWNSIKDRYKPFEMIGKEGEKVICRFIFDAPSANEVWLAGSFNAWCSDKNAPKYPDADFTQTKAVIPLIRDAKTGYWTAIIPLAPGRYQYKYVLDSGRVWSPDNNTEQVDDGYGGKNSIIIVIAN